MATASAKQVETPEAAPREPVTATGPTLLQMIKDAPDGFLALTEAEGKQAVVDGDAIIDANQLVDDGLAAVRLTPQGQAKIAAATPQAKAAVKAQLTVTSVIRTDVPPPPNAGQKRGRNGQSKFPFETMEVNQSFHVPATAEHSDPLKSLQASLSLARAKFVEEIEGQTETYRHKEYQMNGDKIALDAEGHRIVTSTEQRTRPATKPTRLFVAAAVGETDPDGKGARIWRTA